MQSLKLRLSKIKITLNNGGGAAIAKKLPETPGIYAYYSNDEILYIGKAKNLRNRVRSYFNVNLDTKTEKMISSANYLGYIKVESELEALLLEAKLIRKFMPRYNIVSKDDKNPLYIVITKEEFPRIVSVRKLFSVGSNLITSYGPFPSSKNVKYVLKEIRKVFPFSDHKLGNRPCLYSHIGLCNPCPSFIKITNDKSQITNLTKQYRRNIKNIKQILDGQINSVVKKLNKEMLKLSQHQRYEEAKTIHNKLLRLEYISAPHLSTDEYLENPNLYEDKRNKEMLELKKVIVGTGLKLASLKRIECYDIAHLSGTHPTASMVVFINGDIAKSEYRYFKIAKENGGDDFKSINEVAVRRLNHLKDWGEPDLIVIDGGLGQVKAFKSAADKNNLKIPIVGVAKHPDRLIILPDTKIVLSGAALNLVARLRNEAHRFARYLHHKLLKKSLTL